MVLVPMSQIPAPLWRQTLLRSKRIRQSAIAKKAKAPESTVSRVIAGTYWTARPKGQATAARVQKVIADMLGVGVEEIFPPGEKTEGPAPRNQAVKKKARR